MRKEFEKIILAKSLKCLPPMLEDSLLNDDEIARKYDLEIRSNITLGNTDVSFDCEEFYAALKQAVNASEIANIEDSDGGSWEVVVESLESGSGSFFLLKGENRLPLNDFSFFSLDRETRIKALDAISKEIYLPEESIAHWRKLVAERVLDYKEIEVFHSEIGDSVVCVSRRIRNTLELGDVSVSSLVPSGFRYYRRLIGEYDGSGDIEEYAQGRLTEVLSDYLKWSRDDGSKFGLHILLHPSITKTVSIEGVEGVDLGEVYRYLKCGGSPIEQIAGVEIGMVLLEQMHELESDILDLIDAICDDRSIERMFLFSSIFVLVEGELSRRNVFNQEPPFYRRLASMAHSNVIYREVVNRNLGDDFAKWAREAGVHRFLMQTYVDMRSEPRWQPDFFTAENLKSYLQVRLINSLPAEAHESKEGALYDRIFGKESGSVLSLLDFGLFLHLGPLDGADSSALELPKEFSDAIEGQLRGECENGPSALNFTALVNTARVYSLKSEHAKLASDILKAGKHRLSKVEDRSLLVTVLKGLASVASVTRCKDLADELRILDRKYRHDRQFSLSVHESLLLCLSAAGSRSDFAEWCEYVGEWITELSFSEFPGSDADLIYLNLRLLLHCVPELWLHCSEAEAALQACIDLSRFR